MEQNKNIKDMSAALNARLFLLFIGIMLAVNGLTVSLRNGWGYLDFAGKMEKIVGSEEFLNAGTEAVSETEQETGAAEASSKTASATPAAPATDEEIARRLTDGGIVPRDLRLMGILCLLQMAAEIIVGLICAVLSNRVDKSRITFAAVVVLLSVEAVCLSVQFFMRAIALSSLLYTVIMPLVLLWAVLKMRKIAKADPERKYAVMPRGKRPASGPGADGSSCPGNGTPPAAAGKTLRERAMMKTDDENPEDQNDGTV